MKLYSLWSRGSSLAMNNDGMASTPYSTLKGDVMSQIITQWAITAGPGKFDLMLAAFGEKDEPLTFGLTLARSALRTSKKVHVNGILREGGKDSYMIFGTSGGDQVVLYYRTKREKGDTRPNLGFLEVRPWEAK